MSAPLENVMVVSVEQAVAAPLATRHLADLGATVLKVERPDGGDFARSYDTKVAGQSAFFVWGNRGKESICLDLKNRDDRAVFDAVVAGADVFVQNLSPAAAHRAGVAAQQLHEAHPRLIACDISGYGANGPRTDDKAYDLAIQAEAGAMALTGSAAQMSKVGFSVADISAGMYALSSILAALYRRFTTGEGAAIELSMLECLTEWTAVPIYAAAHTGVVPERAGHRHALIAPYGLFTLSDERTIIIAVQSDREWQALALHVLGDSGLGTHPHYATNELRITNVDELEALISAHLSKTPADVVLAGLEAGRIAHAGVRNPLEVWQHEQLEARNRFLPVSVPGGQATTLRPPFNISDCPDPVSTVPALGEHNRSTVEEFTARSRPV